MAFSCYLISKFEYTHENQFFRSFYKSLKKKFENKNGKHILIGNISVNGNAIDAIFIRKGQISVIDFKDYSGKLHFSENNEWRMETPDGHIILVHGGARQRNPFQQVKEYRFAVFPYLAERQDIIIEGVRNNIRWDHTGSIVLFQGKVTYDIESIPNNVRRWFHISDIENIQDLLSDIYSSNLNFTDQEIENILSVLDVDLANKYNEDDHPPTSYPPDNNEPEENEAIEEPDAGEAGVNDTNKRQASTSLEIIYYPSGEINFKQVLLQTKKAYILLHKVDGTKELNEWNASRFSLNSDVNKNLRSGYLRGWKIKGIFKAEISTNKKDLKLSPRKEVLVDAYKILSVEIVPGISLNRRWSDDMQKITTDKGIFIDNMPGSRVGNQKPGFDWSSKIDETVHNVKVVSRGDFNWLKKQ